ncbi:MAG: S-layer homology domain-containing protein [Cyanobacteria bacterium P01_F01_bin.33]
MSQQHSSIRGRCLRTLALASSFAVLLAGCQSTEWGQRISQAIAPAQSSSPPEREPSEPTPAASPTEPISDGEVTPTPAPVQSALPTLTPTTTRFQDLDEAPEAREAIAALDTLEVFDEVAGNRFAPDRSLRRGEYARWVVRANNALYADRPARHIRLGKTTEAPEFLDVPEDRPDFTYIQALAHAGLVERNSDGEFQPDKLLSRAELIRIKTAIDIIPPTRDEATARQAVRDLWGFNDVDDIPADILNALIADAELEDNSTLRRTFGLIRAFDPQTPVTRGEAAIALAEFGPADERRSAIEIADVNLPAVNESSLNSDEPTPAPSETPAVEEAESAPEASTASPAPETEPAPENTPSASEGSDRSDGEASLDAPETNGRDPSADQSDADFEAGSGRFITDTAN